MNKILSEAGRLYLKDIDVLEEARNALTEYVDAVWLAFRSSAGFSGKEVTVASLTWKEYVVAEAQGQHANFWAPGVNLQIGVCDPLVADNARTCQVWLHCAKKEKERLQRAGVTAHAEELAHTRGIRLSFADVEVLATEDVSFDVDDAEDVGRRLAETFVRFLEHAAALHAAVGPASPEAVDG